VWSPGGRNTLSLKLSASMRAFLKSVTVDDTDPALYLAWDDDAVEAFVLAANALGPGVPARPAFLPPAPGVITVMCVTVHPSPSFGIFLMIHPS
jgi:hypothetical protein